MAWRQIFVRLHLGEAACRALELEGAVARDIEPVGFGRRAGEQLDPIFIERVDQRDKARRLVAVFRAHARYADDDHAVEMARDGEIVGRAAGLRAQALKGKDRDALQRLRHMQCPPAADVEVERGDVRARSEEHTSELQSLMRISYAVFCLK